ncbi:hypothetical protein H6P81_006159 [Aristolochia fimbriata]|uniref:Uncharacterized protein n=1 Tax=Aristolochia fimbriata TaxID=158543 RepID=A0AAV7EWI1_ARIFI|nr:hypothetical protein H6P81_006159 [Aristolochia fimbriata]
MANGSSRRPEAAESARVPPSFPSSCLIALPRKIQNSRFFSLLVCPFNSSSYAFLSFLLRSSVSVSLQQGRKMGKQCNGARSSGGPAKGKVTPIQVAFIVDRYLSENNCVRTLSVFRSEATPLISKTKIREAPKNLLSLETILDEYISLKEQKLALDQEKCRVELLLQGIQDVMRAYNSAVPSIPQPPVASGVYPLPPAMTPVSQTDPRIRTPAGYTVYKLPVANSLPVLPPHTPSEPSRISTPNHDISAKSKRKASKPLVGVNPTAKRNCTQVSSNASVAEGNKGSLAANKNNQMPVPYDIVSNQTAGQALSDETGLMKSSPDSKFNSPCPRTPPQALTVEANETVSPAENSSQIESSNSMTSPEISPINCHIISSKTIVVSPSKHVACSSPDRLLAFQKSPKRSSKIKGRLDFNDANEFINSGRPCELENRAIENIDDIGMFDIDFSNFDVLGNDFSLSELLVDIDFDTEGDTSPAARSLDRPIEQSGNSGSDPVGCNLPDLTTILSEKDINIPGPDPLVSVKSVTKCIQILSPAKPRRGGQENS